MNPAMDLPRCYISPPHTCFGHHSRPPGNTPVQEAGSIEYAADTGIRGGLGARILTDGELKVSRWLNQPPAASRPRGLRPPLDSHHPACAIE